MEPLQALSGSLPFHLWKQHPQKEDTRSKNSDSGHLTFFTLACSAFESFSAFLASFSSCFAVN